jgi:hypothetical protein
MTPAKLVSTNNYDREKYLEMLLDSAEAGLVVFGFNRSYLDLIIRKHNSGMKSIINVGWILNQQKQSYEVVMY